MMVVMVVVVVEGQTNTLRATVSWQQTKYVTVSDTRHTRSPAGCHSGLIISQPVSSGRVALLPVVTDTQTKGVGNFKTSGALYLSCSHHIKSHSDFRQLRMSCQITDSVDDHFLQIYIFDLSFLFVYLAKSLLTSSCYLKGQVQGLG